MTRGSYSSRLKAYDKMEARMIIIGGEVKFASAEDLAKGQDAYVAMIAASRGEQGCIS